MGVVNPLLRKETDLAVTKIGFQSFSGKKCATLTSLPVNAMPNTTLFSSEAVAHGGPIAFNKSGLLVTAANAGHTKVGTAKAQFKKRHPSLMVPEALLIAASETVEDPFWKTTVRNAADSKWPRGFKFRCGVLLYQHKNKMIECPLNETMTPTEVAAALIQFIQVHSGMQSEQDRRENRAQFRTEVRQTAPPRLSGGNKKKEEPSGVAIAWASNRTRAFYLGEYIMRMGKEHACSTSERTQLAECLRYGVAMNWITKNTVQFAETPVIHIVSIEGVGFSKQERTWTIAPPPDESTPALPKQPLTERLLADGPPVVPITALCPLPNESARLSDVIKSMKDYIKPKNNEDVVPLTALASTPLLLYP